MIFFFTAGICQPFPVYWHVNRKRSKQGRLFRGNLHNYLLLSFTVILIYLCFFFQVHCKFKSLLVKIFLTHEYDSEFLTTLGNMVKGNSVVWYASMVTVIYTLFFAKRRSAMDRSDLQTLIGGPYIFLCIYPMASICLDVIKCDVTEHSVFPGNSRQHWTKFPKMW